MVADREHIAAGGERTLGTLDDAAHGCGTDHREVIGEHHALETQLIAQDAADPPRRGACRYRIDLGIEHMRHHHAGEPVGDQQSIRRDVGIQVDEPATVHRQRMVRVRHDRPMTREMFGRRRHAGAAHSGLIGDRQRTDHRRVGMQCPVPDDLAHPVVEIDAGRERQIDAVCAQFRRHQPAELPRQRRPGLRVGIMFMADTAQRRQLGEPRAEALDPPAFVIDADDQRRRTHRMDIGDQPGQLLGFGVVAREEDHAADRRVRQQFALLRLQHRTLEIDHEWTEGHRVRSRTAMDSTCVVWGNMSITPAASRR